MSRLRAITDFLTFRNLPAHRIEARDALGAMQVAYQVGRPIYPKRLASVYDEQAYRKIALIFRCINVVANSIASAPIRVYERGGDQQETELPDHPLRRLMERPNPTMGETVFIATVMTAVASAGFCVIEKARSGAGRPVELWPLRSDWILPIPRSDGMADWEYRIPGREQVVIPAEDVIVITYAATPDYQLTGIGPLEVALREWGLLNTMQDFLKAFFDGGAMPTYGLLLADGVQLKKEDAELLQQQWMNRYSGWRSGQVAPPVLQTIKGIQRLSFDYNELAYIDLRDVSEIAVLQAFGVPGSLVGQRYAQERNTFSNYGEARKSFYQETIIPLWARIDDALTRALLPEFDQRPNVSLRFDDSDVEALQEDENAKWTRAKDGLTAGGMTVNEYRREIGLPDDPGGDIYLRAFNIIEVPAGKKAVARSATVTVREIEPKAIAAETRQARGLVSLETRNRIETRAHRVYTQAALSYGPKVQAFLDGQKARVLAVLGERSASWPLESRDAISELLALDWGQEDAELDKLIRQLWNLMGETATTEAVKVLGLADDVVRWDIANPWVREVLDVVGVRVTEINATTRQGIAQVVGDALNEGVTIKDLSNRLEGLYDETYRGRSETIARTESQVAYNTASVRGYEESGVVSEVELLDNPKHDTDPGSDGLTCAGRNGLIVELAKANTHIEAEHQNGSMAIAPVVALLSDAS